MARLAEGNPALSSLQSSVFSSLVARLRSHQGPIFPLHVGDTYMEPPRGARLADQTEDGIHRYAIPKGRADLIDAIISDRSPDRVLERGQVLVTVGATGGLSTAVRSLFVPGQRVLLLAPYWPLIRGMSVSHGLTTAELPFYDRITTAEAARAALEAQAHPDLAAVYVNLPNNPSGQLASREVVEEIVAFAQRHDLWILSDEVYEDYVFRGELVRPGDIAGAEERLLSVYSFSKAYGMAGNRVGYLIGPERVIDRIERLQTYLNYGTGNGAQQAAAVALRKGHAWLCDAKQAYREIASETAAMLGIPSPAGGTFHFFDVSPRVGPGGVDRLLAACVARGLLVAPGNIFGAEYGDQIRICFTCAPPETVRQGVAILAELLASER